MKKWFLSTYHAWAAAYWQRKADAAEHEFNYRARDRAINRRDEHEIALYLAQTGK